MTRRSREVAPNLRLCYQFSTVTWKDINQFSRSVLVVIFLMAFSHFGRAASVSISAHYREAANIFDIMDCVSGWWDGTFEGAYRKEWKKRFGVDADDQAFFKKYDQFRQKYFKGLGQPKNETGPFSDGLFAKRASIGEDLISPAFYSSQKLSDAFEKLKTLVAAEDLEFLRNFYRRFEPKYQTLLTESKPFAAKAAKTSSKLANKKYASFYANVLNYYSVDEDLKYEVLYIWWPPLEKDFATPSDKYLVIRQNPIKHLEWEDEDVVFHEIVHTISARQPQKQKEEISKAFLSQCPIEGKFPTMKILEEPMAVAIGQALFLETFQPSKLRWDSKLYNYPWISAFAKIIYPVVKSEITNRKKFSIQTAEKLGFLCNELLETAKILNPGA
jgi:hypothetical protein